jgi:hypothetical protein
MCYMSGSSYHVPTQFGILAPPSLAPAPPNPKAADNRFLLFLGTCEQIENPPTFRDLHSRPGRQLHALMSFLSQVSPAQSDGSPPPDVLGEGD